MTPQVYQRMHRYVMEYRAPDGVYYLCHMPDVLRILFELNGAELEKVNTIHGPMFQYYKEHDSEREG